MVYLKRYLPLSRVIMIMAVAAFVMGAVFIAQGVIQENWMKDAMRLEQVTVGLDQSALDRGELVDSAAEAMAAGDLIREHRRGIAATYDELLAGGRYDPTNPAHLSYAQALNMENYLYLGVLGFGVTQIAMAAGGFMLVVGLGLGATSVAIGRRHAS